MHLNEWGKIVERGWLAIPTHNSHVELDEFVVMPNHFHGILIIGMGDRGGDYLLGRGEAFAPESPGNIKNLDANYSLGTGEAFALEAYENIKALTANASPLRVDGSESGRMDGRPNGTQPGSIGAIVQTFKSQTTRKINRINQSKGRTLWQRNYYEHIVRNEEALQRIRTYIQMNPRSWASDQLHPTP